MVARLRSVALIAAVASGLTIVGSGGLLGYSAWVQYQDAQTFQVALCQTPSAGPTPTSASSSCSTSEDGCPATLPATPSAYPSGYPSAPSAAPSAVPSTVNKPSPSPSSNPFAPGVLFLLKVPKIGYSAPVREGTTTAVMYLGPGHYPETPMPGERGNVGIAAHNTYWINFGSLRAGDAVTIQTRTATIGYTISYAKQVAADDKVSLAPTTDYRLTLTTCWPLWAGAAATSRYVVVAIEDETSQT